MTARVDVPVGTVFGRLTVIEEAPRTPRGERAMLCRCECGETKVATVGALRCGDAKSCGCSHQGAAIPPGTVFGRLTVIGEAPRTGARSVRAMLCRCECGTTKVVGLGNLRHGQVTSCGCARSDRAIDVPPGTVFRYLTVVGEAPRMGPHNSRAMLCRCECGEHTTVQLSALRSGNTKSCGCRGGAPDRTELQPGEVPLFGKKARGRVVLVDPDDYGLTMQYRWHVLEHDPVAPGRRQRGPYAVCEISQGNGKRTTLYMHVLIMGQPYIDHVNHNGLDNRRVNLRPATQTQNLGNSRKNPTKTSRYKGVYRDRRRSKWVAQITAYGRTQHLGKFAKEEDAGLAYDVAARAAFGEFAKLNFNYESAADMDAKWQAAQEESAADREARAAELRRRRAVRMTEWWRGREPETRTCISCGGTYETLATGSSFYCSDACQMRYYRRQGRERQQEGRLF